MATSAPVAYVRLDGEWQRGKAALFPALRTLCLPRYTVAKLPLPISSSMLKEPTIRSPVLERLEDDPDGAAILRCEDAPRASDVSYKIQNANDATKSSVDKASRSVYCAWTHEFLPMLLVWSFGAGGDRVHPKAREDV